MMFVVIHYVVDADVFTISESLMMFIFDTLMLLMMEILTISEFADREIDQWFMFIFDTLMLMMLRILTLMMFMMMWIWHLEVDDDYNFDIEDVDDVENFDTCKVMMMRILTLKMFMMIFY